MYSSYKYKALLLYIDIRLAQIHDNMDEQVRIYNTRIRELLDLISAEIPDHPLISTIHRRFRVAITSDRTYIIQETGQELWSYRDVIAEERWDDLIHKNWEEEIEKKDGALMHEVNNNSLKQMVSLLREIWSRYGDEEQGYIKKSMKKLLSTYIRYLKAKAEDRE